MSIVERARIVKSKSCAFFSDPLEVFYHNDVTNTQFEPGNRLPFRFSGKFRSLITFTFFFDPCKWIFPDWKLTSLIIKEFQSPRRGYYTYC